MATDPTQQIRRRRFSSPFAIGADDLLDRIAHLEPATDVPYLTVALDWTVEGSNPGRQEPEEVLRSQSRSGWQEGDRWRPSVEVLERELDRLIDEHGPRGDIFDSLTEDKARIEEFLSTTLAQEAQGVWIIANASKGVFEATGLAMPVETEIRFEATPRLYGLVRMIEDNPLYGVLLADQHDATLSFIARGHLSRQSQLLSNEWPRKQQQGGWSQRRFQARADERVDAFARDIADETQKAMDRLGVETLIVAGGEVITSALNDAFHDSVKERIADTIRMEMVASEHEMIEATLPIAEEAERARESAAVERLQDRVGSGERGAAGMADTLRALQNGQVDELVVSDTFEGTGWADYGMHVFGVGNLPTQHPLGGDVGDIVEIDLREEFVRLALATDADVEVIHSDVPVPESGDIPDAGEDRPMTDAARALTDLGGVGAILRFDLQETAADQSV